MRPALILFTDGKHDVKGVPGEPGRCPTRDQLFGNRTPFALLPVGMGLDPKERGALTAGLDRLKIVKDMPACASGATLRLADRLLQLAGRGGQRRRGRAPGRDLHVHRRPDADPADPAAGTDRGPGPGHPGRARRQQDRRDVVAAGSRAAPRSPTTRSAASPVDGDPVESTEGVSIQPHTTVEGLANGTSYTCEVATVSAGGVGPWVAATTAATPDRQAARPAAARRPGRERRHLDRAPEREHGRRRPLPVRVLERQRGDLAGRRSTRRRSSRRPSSAISRTGPSIAAGPTRRTTSA